MAMPRTIRLINERRVFDVLFQQGAKTRAELSRELELTRATVGNLVASLASSGLIKDCIGVNSKQVEVKSGRPGSLVDINTSHASFLGVAIGIDSIQLIAIDLRGSQFFEKKTKLSVIHSNPEKIIAKVVSEIMLLKDEYNFSRCKGIGVSIPGLVSKDGRIIRAPLLKWKDINISQNLRKCFPDIPIILIENDANSFAIAEQTRISSNHFSNAIYLLLDVGVGGGIISNGHLLRGSHGSAGEIGHISMQENSENNLGGLSGSLESFIGLKGFLDKYKPIKNKSKSLHSFICDYKNGSIETKLLLNDWSRNISRCISILSCIFDPDVIVFGGPGSELVTLNKLNIERDFKNYLLPDQKYPQISISDLKENAPATGSAFLVLNQFLFETFSDN